MKKVIYLLLAVTCCFLLLSRETQAQSVYGDAWLEYDDLTNTVHAIGYSAPDYTLDVYYCVEVQVYLYQGDEYLGSQGAMNVNEWGWPTGCSGLAQVDLEHSYDPNSDYFIEVAHTVTDIQIPQQTEYHDPYGFYTYLMGDSVYFPGYYQFMGTGYPGSGQSITSLLLGFTFSILQQGVTSGPPHHLQVIHDRDVVRTDLCWQVQKQIDFLVVDQPGRAAGKVYIDEKPQSVTDSCSAGPVTLSLCSSNDVSRYGNFKDGIKTGCPHTGPSVCGFDFFNRWRWCGPGCANTQDLAWMYYVATRTVITVDNEPDMEDLSYKFP